MNDTHSRIDELFFYVLLLFFLGSVFLVMYLVHVAINAPMAAAWIVTSSVSLLCGYVLLKPTITSRISRPYSKDA